MIDSYRKILSLLDARERRRVGLVLILLVLVALTEVLGVASIMPFMAVLARPEIVYTNPYLASVYRLSNMTSPQGFLLLLGLLFFALLIASLSLKALSAWVQLHFSHNRCYSWSQRLVGGYLAQPYDFFLNRHSAELATTVIEEVVQVVDRALFPALRLVAQGLIAMLLLGLLILVNPVLALALGAGLGGGYALIALTLRRRLRQLGAEKQAASRRRFKVVQEAFGGIKEIKLAGLEPAYLSRFREPAHDLARRNVAISLISELPYYATQALLFGGMLLVLLYLMQGHGGLQDAIPILSVYAFGGYRLMPSIQAMYQAVSDLRFSQPVLDTLCRDMAAVAPRPAGAEQGIRHQPVRLPLESQLQLHAVDFQYPGSERTTLNGLSLTITARTTVAFVGSTGSGKTTLVDVMMGLLQPTAGAVRVDGQAITGDLVRRWQRSIGYVPQHIFLADDSIAANIAFGIPPGLIDMTAVEQAARVANLHEFVVKDLPGGYDTHVGERGVRLSGGQRQRIGIARALYRNPDLLVLDEATSALDNITEHAVMDAVHNLGGYKTIVMIAHRLSTVRACDCIFLLEGGRVVASGTYDQLLQTSPAFRALAEFA